MKAFLVFLLTVAVASAGHHDEHHDEHHAPAHYKYEYKVHDPHTGDIKTHEESRKGDAVKGVYTLKEADGSTREVHYSADKHTGFSADVKSSGEKSGHHSTVHHPSHHSTVHHSAPSTGKSSGHGYHQEVHHHY